MVPGKGYCNFCKTENKYCIKPCELADLFSPLIELYNPVDHYMPMEMFKRI